MYAWGADLTEPKLLWSRYDENGNLNTNDEPINEEVKEVNKGKLKSDN